MQQFSSCEDSCDHDALICPNSLVGAGPAELCLVHRFSWVFRADDSRLTLPPVTSRKELVQNVAPPEREGIASFRIQRQGLHRNNHEEVLSAGWPPVTYRQNNELHVEAWQVPNQQGQVERSWRQGDNLSGTAKPGTSFVIRCGYALPHRGSRATRELTTNGFSALTRWRREHVLEEHPYLAKPFTGENDANYPQCDVIDLAHNHRSTPMRMSWAPSPCVRGRRYSVSVWNGQ